MSYLEYAMFKVLEIAMPRQDESLTDLRKYQITFTDIIIKTIGCKLSFCVII